MNNKIIKLGNIEFKENDIKKLYFEDNKKFIIAYKNVFQIFYSSNYGFYAKVIYKDNDALPLTKRGHFLVTNANAVNNLIGHGLVID